MKLYFLVVGILLITFNTNAQNTQKNFPIDSAAPYRPFIQSIREKTVFKELPDYNKNPPPAFITKQQALEDIEMLQYIIDNAFSGRDYWQSTGLVNFKALYSQLKKMVEAAANNQVSTAAMEDTIYSHLSNINDAHTHIVGFKDRELVRNYRPYFSTVILEKKRR